MAKTKELKQVHGKKELKKTQFTTMDQIFGDTGKSKYGTMDEEEYQAMLREMTQTDLHSHANKHGIIPVHRRERLEGDLMRKFRRHVATFNVPTGVNTVNPTAVNTLPKKVQKTLAEGR